MADPVWFGSVQATSLALRDRGAAEVRYIILDGHQAHALLEIFTSEGGTMVMS